MSHYRYYEFKALQERMPDLQWCEYRRIKSRESYWRKAALQRDTTNCKYNGREKNCFRWMCRCHRQNDPLKARDCAECGCTVKAKTTHRLSPEGILAAPTLAMRRYMAMVYRPARLLAEAGVAIESDGEYTLLSISLGGHDFVGLKDGGGNVAAPLPETCTTISDSLFPAMEIGFTSPQAWTTKRKRGKKTEEQA